MSLYRGAGGASDATDDSTVNAVAGYAASAATSATNAATSAANANTSASTAASSASSASSSASSVATNAANAASSASLANTYAGQASASKDAAAASAVIASTQAGLASSSQSNAASSAATATTKAGEAAASAVAAEGFADDAADSAADALAIYGDTATMQAAVAAAAASASSASTQASNAAASAVDADESEDLAYEHEQNAAEWATVAQGAANSSQAYSAASAAARDAALAALDSFDDRYLGQKAADPVTDNDGNTLVAGALYFNNQDNVMKVYEGSVWVAAYASLSGALLVNNNLSDVASVSAARTNLGLGTAAVTDSTAYATAAQGTNADTAFGWGNHASAGYAADSAVVKLTGDQTVAGTKTFSSTVSGSITGNAGTVTNGVYTSGDQTIGGTKTFSSTISGSITGNAGTATNGVVTTGSYADPSWITSISGSKVTGDISGNAGTVTNGVYTTGDQTIGGVKTFSSTIQGSVSGNAGTVTNGVYTSGDQTIAGTKTFSSNPALSAGTANGVAYLNGSKVLTTGSALVFDGTNLGVGATPAYPLHVQRSSYGVTGYFYTNDGTGNPRLVISGSSSGTTIQNTWSSGASNLIFANGGAIGSGTEVARFDVNGNLGIGTSSPLAKLHVKGAINGNLLVRGGASAASGLTGTALSSINDAASATVSLTFEGSDFNFVENNAVVAKLDSSGNLGLGVTPSAWTGTFSPAVQVKSAAIVSAADLRADLLANAYYDGSAFKYIDAGHASSHSQVQGTHRFFTAPSGTAGNAISFSQAMTLDASGNLQLATTTSSSRNITVGGSSASISLAGSNGGIYFGATGTPPGSGGFGGNAAIARAGGADFHITGSAAGDLCIAPEGTKAILFGTSASAGGVSERMRLDASGNLGVGTTSPADKLQVVGGVTFGGDSGANRSRIFESFGLTIESGAASRPIIFGTNNTERARIDTSGNLLVNTTTALPVNNAEAFSVQGGQARIQRGDGGNFVVFYNSPNSAQIGSISNSGGGSVTLYNTTSDQRLKENIIDAPEFGSVIDSIKVRSYDWKSDGSHQRYGFIAQELVTVAPEAVYQPADPEEMMAVDYSKLVPMLVKEIQSLRQRLAALESN
jgi:hypothetical protein